MRIAIVYDCLHPWTVGGQERWLRQLTETACAAGHQVTYLTRRQWVDPPDVAGVRVVAVSPAGPLYGQDGNRRTTPTLQFAAGVGRHLLLHRGDYDVVHTCGFPYFHLPALRAALAGTGVPVVVDWPEVWSRDYWRAYVGGPAGLVAEQVQRLCLRLTPVALAWSDLYGTRLERAGVDTRRLGGLGPDARPGSVSEGSDRVVFAGRHIREKRPELVVRALSLLPELTGVVFGDGPERDSVLALVDELGVPCAVPGFVAAGVLAGAVGDALCLLHPSSREGFGIVVLEAAAVGTPVVVVAGADNAAVELVVPGVNGEIAVDDSPEAVAAAVLRVRAGGQALRDSTAAWYAEHAHELSASRAAERVLDLYAELLARGSDGLAGPAGLGGGATGHPGAGVEEQ